jgi:hypothetical protein
LAAAEAGEAGKGEQLLMVVHVLTAVEWRQWMGEFEWGFSLCENKYLESESRPFKWSWCHNCYSTEMVYTYSVTYAYITVTWWSKQLGCVPCDVDIFDIFSYLLNQNI